MKITIEELNRGNLQDVNKCENERIIDAKLVLYLDKDIIKYHIEPVPETRKCYQSAEADYSAYIADPGRTVFLAYADGRVAGQIILRRNWNEFAYVEDLTVDVRSRRQGIGEALIDKAVHWAEDHGMAGIMLETQDNNVPACKFYESCGFRLMGFDANLYKGMNPDTDEIALFWYLLFDKL